jgi:hypothetical protein
MILAEALRRVHDAGQIHGALTPAHLHLTANGIELLPAEPGPTMSITPYTAPEALVGRALDARCDIFGFGAIVFEMLTGRRAFDGEGRTTLAANIANAAAPSSGSPAVDRVVGPCLVKNPDARIPRMQKVIMELKLLAVAVRRAEAAAAPRRESIDADTMRGEMRELEARLEAHMASRLQTHERAAREMQRSTNDAVATVKCQLSALRCELTEAQERTLSAVPAASEDQLDAISRQILAQVDRNFQIFGENIAAIERTVDGMKQHAHQFEHSVAADLVDIEQSIKAQATGIESARTAMSQTDDLVERVVEALESLQSAVLDSGDMRVERVAFAVN